MSQAEFKRRLKALMLLPENQVCSDCPERQPRWASLIVPPPGAPPGSIPMGAFCCLECSGSHRRLGVHISFVRSVNLDQWKEKEVLAMENGGNQKVNAIFEARLSVSKPTNAATGPVRERFIRDKYERRKFYDPSAFERVSQIETRREQEEVVSGVQRRLQSGGSRKPSDAARARVAERAARNRSAAGGGGGGGGSAVRNSGRAAKAPAPPAPAPAPVADLLDFGNFDSPEATSAVQASVATANNAVPAPTAAPPAAPPKEPELDLFANMSIGNNPGGVVANGGGQMPQQAQQQPEQKKMTNSDIMSMFNAPSAQQHNPMQQNMFAMGGGMSNGNTNMNNTMGMMNNMGGGGMPNNNMNMGMMNGSMNPQHQQQMGMMNNMQQMMQMQNMMGHPQQGGGMGNTNMGGNAMNMGMMGGQQGMGNMGGGGMMMQQQQPQMNNMMMMQGGGGGMMQHQGGGGGQFGMQQSNMMGGQQMQGQKQQRGGHVDQFADFGNFGR